MNVIVTNKQKDIIDNANIDAIKDFNGLFNVDDLINKVKNYFFSKLILDATSIVNFSSKDVLEKLASSIGTDRLVILLPADIEPPQDFVNMLVDLKIFNFSTKINDIVRFISVPNTYDNVVGISNNNQSNFYVDNSIKASDDYIPENNALFSANQMNNNTLFDPVINSSNISDNLQNDSINNFTLQSNVNNNLPNNLNNTNFNINPNENVVNTQGNITNSFNNGQAVYSNINNPNNYSNNFQNNNYMNNDFSNNQINPLYSFGNTASPKNDFYNENFMDSSNQNVIQQNIDNTNLVNNNSSSFYQNSINTSNKFVLGVKNITSHAGSTTLIYLLMKAAREKLNLRVNAIEIGKDDFKYYNDADMISTTADNVRNVINSSTANLILVDLNDYYGNFDFFNDIIYLVEPSVIKLNKLMMNNRFVFKENSKNKLILNISLLSKNDVSALSKEAGVNFIMNIPPLNDRVHNDIILNLLSIFGIK